MRTALFFTIGQARSILARWVDNYNTERPHSLLGYDTRLRSLPGSNSNGPTIVRGVVVTGHQVLDGQDRWAPSGVIQGFDAVTGRLAWAWDMMHPDWNGYPPAGQTWARGTPNMWTIASGDEQLGLVYLPMGNAAADYYSSLRRPPENDFATSLVALDVTTGKPRWHFQAVRKDVWDYDFGAQATVHVGLATRR